MINIPGQWQSHSTSALRELLLPNHQSICIICLDPVLQHEYNCPACHFQVLVCLIKTLKLIYCNSLGLLHELPDRVPQVPPQLVRTVSSQSSLLF